LGQVRTAARVLRQRAQSRRAAAKVESRELSVAQSALDTLRDRGTEVLLLLSDGEFLLDMLTENGLQDGSPRWPNLTIDRLRSFDHMFRSAALQAAVNDSIDRACRRVIENLPAEADGDSAALGSSATL